MIEIFIEGKQLDVSNDLSHLLTFAIDDIKDFASRNTTFSKTIILPGTAKNNRLLGYVFDVRISNPYLSGSDNVATNFNPAVSANCLIFQNRMQVFKGTLRLLEVIIDGGNVEYEVAVFGELGGLVSAIGAGKLEDLDFSAYNHVWNAANVTGSWDSSPGSGYYYPLIDYGTVSAAKVNYDIRAFRPALYVKEYIDKIMNAAGYSYTCDLFNTSRFKGLIIPNNQKTLQSKSTAALFVEHSDSAGGSAGVVGFAVLTNLGSFTSNTPDDTVFTYGGADSFVGKVSVELSFGLSHSDSQGFITFYLYKNGAQITELGQFQEGGSHSLVFSNYNIAIANSDYVEIRYTVSPTGFPHTWTLDLDDGGFLKIESAAEIWTDINYGDTVEVNDTIARNVLQKDFLSSIIKMFNLYLYEDSFSTKKILIKPYVDFYNVTGSTDWTYKVDRSRPLRMKPMSELNSRYYNFTYKDDVDYYNDLYKKTYNETYGSYVYDSAYEFASDKTEIPIIFSGTPLVGYVGCDKIVSTLFKLNNLVEERTQTNIRILQSKKITGVSSWYIKDGLTALTGALTDYGYAGHLDDPDAPANDLNFGVLHELYFTLAAGAINVNQFNVYWSPYMAEITDKDSKLLTCYMKLSVLDIFNIDFSTHIYIDGSLWRLNKIEDWNAAEPDVCRCEFLKVINTIY